MTAITAGAPVTIYLREEPYIISSNDWEKNWEEIGEQLVAIARGLA